jgi:branched-chain amino acid transport system ATP-binding protein
MLDEPSLGLAPHLVNVVFETLVQLRTDGVTILLVEQFAQKALSISDTTHVLRGGKLVGTSTRDAPMSAMEVESWYFGALPGRADCP